MTTRAWQKRAGYVRRVCDERAGPALALLDYGAMVRGRVAAAAVLTTVSLAGCERVAEFQAGRARHARAEELLRVQRESTAQRAELQKSLHQETWGRVNDYQLQRDGREIRLWRANEGGQDTNGKRMGVYCILNTEGPHPWGCNEQQRKLGRILLDVEESDRRFNAATDELLTPIKVQDRTSKQD